MAWSASKIFTAYIRDIICNTTAMDLDTDALLEVALFDNSITPSQIVSAANSAYAAGVWATSLVDTGSSAPAGWPALGRPLVSTTVSAATVNPITVDAADTVSANAVTTLTAAFGCLIYDHSAGTVTDQGICYNYFGGTNSVTLGTFTVVWNASGILAITL